MCHYSYICCIAVDKGKSKKFNWLQLKNMGLAYRSGRQKGLIPADIINRCQISSVASIPNSSLP